LQDIKNKVIYGDEGDDSEPQTPQSEWRLL